MAGPLDFSICNDARWEGGRHTGSDLIAFLASRSQPCSCCALHLNLLHLISLHLPRLTIKHFPLVYPERNYLILFWLDRMTSTSKTRPYLVAFDFDWCVRYVFVRALGLRSSAHLVISKLSTITEEDTDRFVIETLASELIPKVFCFAMPSLFTLADADICNQLKELHSTVQWTDLMVKVWCN